MTISSKVKKFLSITKFKEFVDQNLFLKKKPGPLKTTPKTKFLYNVPPESWPFFKSEEGLKCRGTLRICSQDLLPSHQKSGLSPTQDKSQTEVGRKPSSNYIPLCMDMSLNKRAIRQR
ncbi:hypothetical protein CEXT_314151 [Caerostris extrusa]|uniref:Uncharacterized protein n=1 Tax=Caerostris extrusa TaxID=172846 RepID=A0AAV4WFE0_CAEEX|nr:hypothetical protein CEXT_314151 [Caerostris extrusa]